MTPPCPLPAGHQLLCPWALENPGEPGLQEFLRRHHCLLSNLMEPPLLSFPRSLTVLHLSHSQLSRLPPSLSSLPHLTSLDLSHNQISSLPASLTSAPRLTSLLLHCNLLTQPPPWLHLLHRCYRLSLGGNPFQPSSPLLPPSLGTDGCRRIKYLHIGSVGIKQLPEPVLQLQDLRHLSLSALPGHTPDTLWSLPDSLGSRLPSLERLEGEGITLTVLPDSLIVLSRLSVLQLADNCLSWLPSSFNLLKGLRYCDLSKNQLLLLPPDLSSLPSLSHFLAADNRIGELPASLPRCPALTTLDLYSNQLTSLPPGMARLNLLRADFSCNYLELPQLKKTLGKLPYIEMQKRFRSWKGDLQVKVAGLEEARGGGFVCLPSLAVLEREKQWDENMEYCFAEDWDNSSQLDGQTSEEDIHAINKDIVLPNEEDTDEKDSGIIEDYGAEDDDDWEGQSLTLSPEPHLGDSIWRWSCGVGQFCPADIHQEVVNRGLLADWEAWRGRRQVPAPARAPLVARVPLLLSEREDGQWEDVQD